MKGRWWTMLLMVTASLGLTACNGKLKSQIVASCMQGGGPKENCTCLYEKLKDKYGVNTLEALRDHGAIPIDLGPTMVASTVQCSGLDPAVAMKALGAGANVSSVQNPLAGPAAQDGLTPIGGGTPPQESFASDEAAIDSAIAITAAAESGEEFKEARKTALGDIDGNGTEGDLAVLFTIEVGAQNLSTQYLAVFQRQADGTIKFTSTTPVGGVVNAVNGLVIKDEEIRLKTLELGPDDPQCCPTVEKQISYVLHNGKLKRVN